MIPTGNYTLGYGIIPDGITINFSSGGLGILNPETNITTNGVKQQLYLQQQILVTTVLMQQLIIKQYPLL